MTKKVKNSQESKHNHMQGRFSPYKRYEKTHQKPKPIAFAVQWEFLQFRHSLLLYSQPLVTLVFSIGYAQLFNRVHPVVQSGALSYPIGCTQLFNRVHSVAQSGAPDWVIGRVRFFERLCQHYFFCKLFGSFVEMLYLCHCILQRVQDILLNCPKKSPPRKE